MKIEHWRSQTAHAAEQLTYRNLLGACPGGEGQPVQFQHCDTRKGDSGLRWNPADPTHRIESRVRYELDGSIRSDDVLFNEQLSRVLNLNLPRLKKNREGIWRAVVDWWKHEKARIGGPVSREHLIRKRDSHVAGDGELSPHC